MNYIYRRYFIFLLVIISSTLFVSSCGWLFFFRRMVPPAPPVGLGPLKEFSFSQLNALDEWEEKGFRGRVNYFVEFDGEEGYLHAKSQNSASGYYYRVNFRAEDFPWISWKWRAIEFPKKRGFRDIEEDDYAARIYVIFTARFFPLSKCVEYVWDESIPEGTIFSHPLAENIKLIVVQSGRGGKGEWVFEEHNIYEDYLKAFGTEPTLNVGAVAFMSDSENTKGRVEALYDEIKVGYKKVTKEGSN